MRDHSSKLVGAALLLMATIALLGCAGAVVEGPSDLFLARLRRPEIVGFVAGFGTTFAAMPDVVRMIRRRSCAGMNPTMAGIMGLFQIVWVYYGLLIGSRPVIAWNVVAVMINSMSVGAFLYFRRQEQGRVTSRE